MFGFLRLVPDGSILVMRSTEREYESYLAPVALAGPSLRSILVSGVGRSTPPVRAVIVVSRDSCVRRNDVKECFVRTIPENSKLTNHYPDAP